MVVSGTTPLVPGGLLAPRAPPPAPWRPGKALAACALAAGGLAAPPARASAAAVWRRPPAHLRAGEAACPAPRREAARHRAAGRPVRRRTPPRKLLPGEEREAVR